MTLTRSSGILLHPTSLPGPYGIGDLGPEAYRFLEDLAQTGSKLWQILPLGPTGYGDSPYQAFSAFAGNPYLVSPDFLKNDGLLQEEDFADMPAWNPQQVDFGSIFQWKPALLDKAFARFEAQPHTPLHQEFDGFRLDNAHWLQDYALFMALKDAQGGIAWNEWQPPLRSRQPEALQQARQTHAKAIRRQEFHQFLFFRQWNALRNFAHQKGIQIIGDIPIFVAMDSSDAWAHPELFHLDEAGKPTVVAGVPPDYFAPTGQLWGNPLYRWEIHRQTGYRWWVERIRAILQTVDIIRIDHFRGFAGYWEVPGNAPTAENGRWVPGPGIDLFHAIHRALGDLPIIAEDLGEITPDVIELRDSLHLPGMKIHQFGFSGPENPFLPQHYVPNSVVYTGTHDNDTAWGWYNSAPEHEKDYARRYLHISGEDFAWDLTRSCWASVAVMALAPMQDLLNLGSEGRMNFPGKVGGFWGWRMSSGAFTEDIKHRIRELNYLYGR